MLTFPLKLFVPVCCFQSQLSRCTMGQYSLFCCLAEICHIYVSILYEHSVKGCWAMNQMSHGVNMCCEAGSFTDNLSAASHKQRANNRFVLAMYCSLLGHQGKGNK